MKNRKLY